jgi:hypothetical protein
VANAYQVVGFTGTIGKKDADTPEKKMLKCLGFDMFDQSGEPLYTTGTIGNIKTINNEIKGHAAIIYCNYEDIDTYRS